MLAMLHRRPPLPTAVVCLLLLSLVGCEMERRVVSQNPWREMFTQSEWYDPEASGGGGDAAQAQSNERFAVQLAQYTGPQSVSDAAKLVAKARVQTNLADLWYASDAGQATVYAGRFRDPDADPARRTLRLARDIEIDGETPFEDAKLVSLSGGGTENYDPRDLRSLSGKGLYTLQVGYYDQQYGEDFRKAAEDKVDQLRDQGEDAYYYHGPRRSLILINAWTREEAFLSQPGQMDRYSNAVRAAQKKYPHNIPNGEPFTDEDDPEFVKTQHSFLVPIR